MIERMNHAQNIKQDNLSLKVLNNILMKINNYILEFTIFICGAVVMIFELVGSRVLGPYFGTSIFVWTNLIGIILGSLGLGYYLGGKIADKKPNIHTLSFIVMLAAFSIGFTIIIKNFLLAFIQTDISDIRIASVVSSLLLFSPASILLGMVSPYAVKLKIDNLDTTGSTVGNLYAISTTGSIVGTFLSGFFLIPHFGTNKLLLFLFVTLVFVSLMLSLKIIMRPKTAILFVCFLFFTLMSGFYLNKTSDEFIDVDTAYNRIWIYDQIDKKTNKAIKVMGINNENHSSMYLDNSELVNEYTKYFHLAKHFNPEFKKTLMIGGAGYSYPKDFLLEYPEATIDVVEIDPKVTSLAKEHFNLTEDERLGIFHEDARVYLNKTKEKYDVIFGDAFGSYYSIPYQLATKEAVQKKFNILNDNGVIILNIYCAIEGDKGKFLRAEYLTFKSIFPQVYLFPVREPDNGQAIQNIMLVALKSKKSADLTSTDYTTNKYLQHLWKNPIPLDISELTDDFAPVDYYISSAI